jgi:hypothetical protein
MGMGHATDRHQGTLVRALCLVHDRRVGIVLLRHDGVAQREAHEELLHLVRHRTTATAASAATTARQHRVQLRRHKRGRGLARPCVSGPCTSADTWRRLLRRATAAASRLQHLLVRLPVLDAADGAQLELHEVARERAGLVGEDVLDLPQVLV